MSPQGKFLIVIFEERLRNFLLLFTCQVISDSFETPWTAAHQAPLSTGFHRQEYWSALSFPTSGDLPNPGIEPASPV